MLSIDIPEEMNRAVAHPFDLVRMPQSLDDLDFGTNRQDIDFEGVLTLKDFPDLGTRPIYQKQLETYNTRLLYIICNLKNTTLYHRGEIPPRGDPLGEHASHYALGGGMRGYGSDRFFAPSALFNTVGGLRALISLLEVIFGRTDDGRAATRNVLYDLGNIVEEGNYNRMSSNLRGNNNRYDFNSTAKAHQNEKEWRTLRAMWNMSQLSPLTVLEGIHWNTEEYVPHDSFCIQNMLARIFDYVMSYQEVAQGFPDPANFQLRLGKVPVKTLNAIITSINEDKDYLLHVRNTYYSGEQDTRVFYGLHCPPAEGEEQTLDQVVLPSQMVKFAYPANYTGLCITKRLLNSIMLVSKRKTVEFLLSMLLCYVFYPNPSPRDSGNAAAYMVRINDLKLELDKSWGIKGRLQFAQHINNLLRYKEEDQLAELALLTTSPHGADQIFPSGRTAPAPDPSLPVAIPILERMIGVNTNRVQELRTTVDLVSPNDIVLALHERANTDAYRPYGLHVNSYIGTNVTIAQYKYLAPALPTLYDTYVTAYNNRGYEAFMAGDPFKIGGWWL